MAFVRQRKTKAGSSSTALVGAHRDDQGRPRQRVLANLYGAQDTLTALAKLAAETTRKIILRMRRINAGALSPRLAVLTGAPDLRRHFRWQQWLRKIGRRFEVRPAYAVPTLTDPPPPPGLLAGLEPERFAALETYIDTLSERYVDLAICVDCTASMSGELAEVQGGIDDMMLFIGDVVKSLRVGLVGYRDRRLCDQGDPPRARGGSRDHDRLCGDPAQARAFDAGPGPG